MVPRISSVVWNGGSLVLLGIVALSACGTETVSPKGVVLTPVTIQASTSATSVDGIAVEVSAADISPSLLVNLAYDSGTGKWTGSLDVPAGNDRLFTGRAYDATGKKTHEGSTTANVTAATSNPISLTLNPLDNTGSVPIDVTVASRSVSISPTTASITVGSTYTFTSTVEGSACTPTWASSNPGIATVDAAGIATGKVAGAANVVVNCGGIAAAASLTVQ